MMSVQTKWENLTEWDFKIYGEFWRYLKQRNLACFTSDDLRECFKNGFAGSVDCGLEDVFPDASHSLGAWTAKCKMAKLILDSGTRQASVVASNHRRKNTVFRMRGLQDLWEKYREVKP
jgi:hypothetical protein